jgi:murein DD-endopeptidase MepM/ murein hydrolase activator NlpD
MNYRTPLTAHIFCFLLFPFFIFAQQISIDIDENAQNRIMDASVQSCDFYTGINVKNLTIIESNKQIPAYGLYENQWDTLYIRSKKIEIPFFDNHLKIILVQDENSPFAFPVSGIVSTSFIKNKGKQHTGIDFSVQKKEPVVACFDGVVRVVKKFADYGNTVVIRHYNGLETIYATLDNVCVITEQKIKAGELVGHIGINQSKKSTLHFETRFMNEFFNPEKVINFSGRKLQSNLLTITPNDFIQVPLVKYPPVIQEQTKQEQSSSQQQLLNMPTSVPVYHTVERGETIFRICTKYKITEQQLRALNNIKGDHIELGQKLRIK